MTQVPAPTPAVASLRPVEHPELSPLLTHFCSRGRPATPSVSANILAMTPQNRLANILWTVSMNAYVTYSGGSPAVCLTEAGEPGLAYLIRRRGFAPWGLVFTRQGIFNAGGGPVWYARDEEFRALDPAKRHWAVRYAPDSDWVEEREWRVPRPARPDGAAPSLTLAELGGIVGIVVGDLNWSATQYFATPTANVPSVGWHKPWIFGFLHRWQWNAQLSQLVHVAPQNLPPGSPSPM